MARLQELECMSKSTYRGSPVFWESLARETVKGATAPEHYELAAKLWDKAAKVSAGHSRAARYETYAKECRRAGNVQSV